MDIFYYLCSAFERQKRGVYAGICYPFATRNTIKGQGIQYNRLKVNTIPKCGNVPGGGTSELSSKLKIKN